MVTLGWDYDSAQTARMIEQWKSILAAQGFQRVVCVHTNRGDEINGSIVLDDSRFTSKPMLSQSANPR